MAALPAEARCLARSHVRVGASWVVNPRMRVQVGGVGAVGARHAAESLIASGADALVSWGVAAGLDPMLAAGTLVISTRVIAPSGTDRTSPGGTSPGGTSPGAAADEDPVSRVWAERLAARMQGAVSVVRGSVACPGRVLRTGTEKRALGALGAVAADLETAAIAEVATSARVPWLAIRVVVDRADLPVPASVVAAVDATGRVRIGRLLRGLLGRPSDLASLPALARAYRLALQTLDVVARAADAALFVPGAGVAGDRDGREAATTEIRR